MNRFGYILACLLLAIVGCNARSAFPSQEAPQFDMSRMAAKQADATRTEARSQSVASPSGSAAASSRPTPNTPAAGEGQVEATASSTGPAISRKIIYDAQVDLLVDSVDPVARKLTGLIQSAGGFIAEQNVTGSPGSLRSIHWRIRVPVDQFDSFVESVVALGELERNNRTSQDITDQYYDIEARIKNKKVEEQTLQKILQERSGKLEDILKIEIELSRVRGEIEQFQGKIRVLENLSSLATLTLNIREREKYAPPAPVVAGFGTQISRTWDGQIHNLVDVGKAIVLWAVSWAIWIPFLLAGVLLAWILVRKLIPRFHPESPPPVSAVRTPLTRPSTPTPSE